MHITKQDDLDKKDYITELNFQLDEFLSDSDSAIDKNESVVNSLKEDDLEKLNPLPEPENNETTVSNNILENVNNKTDKAVEDKFKQKNIEAALIDLKNRLSKAKDVDNNLK